MSFRVPNGLVLSIATAFGASKNMTAISNAAEAVATLEATHGVVENDIIEVTSGWDGLNGRVVRADSVATNDVTLEDVNTLSTQQYPAGGGAGSVREISTWQPLSQILTLGREGGEMQYADFQVLSDLVMGRRLPTVFSPMSMTLGIGFDPSLGWLPTVRSVSDSRANTPFRISYPGGAVLYGNAVWSINEVPTMEANNVMQISVNLALQSLPIVYAA